MIQAISAEILLSRTLSFMDFTVKWLTKCNDGVPSNMIPVPRVCAHLPAYLGILIRASLGYLWFYPAVRYLVRQHAYTG